jgi:acyl-CoA dehydrogenase
MTAAQPFPKLGQYMLDSGLTHSSQISVTPLTGGQSNPTFRIDCADRQLVLRKKPPGQLLASAHAIDREYRVMNALHGSAVPVARMHVYCDDTSIVGTPFYLMDYVDGRMWVDQSLPGMRAEQRYEIYAEMNRVIAALHGVDVNAVGLGDFGRPGNYFARQIARWSRQCEPSEDGAAPVGDAMQRLMAWLPEHIPDSDETTLVHGDYRMDNLIFHPTQARVIAVLDWELSTLGHPLADFSYQCMSWYIAPALWRGIGGLDLAVLGIPAESAYVEMYTSSTGRDVADNWDFYLAYNLFRMAAILHGISVRAARGNAASADAVETGKKAGPLAELAWQCALRHDAAHRS